ncbi:AraC family transcriptional regulator [Bifidobacterium leontopitheci]|uniref:Transcriptional regulator, AraC family n=1 Tax=Bifidobacterium leontopitheci TaxID=2650774 RepID=A0A6I1GGE8_9BIFI|nr:AraC family transcriptional regulator [Bifidobacterium leontopitheci]KAB7789752.1 Transcriptional regulator, AraC family [Bifidobacterium leontopitheci]
MKPVEQLIDVPSSNYYGYIPSQTALSTYLYPTQVGHYHFRKGYTLDRTFSFDMYILLVIQSGTITFHTVDGTSVAHGGDIVLIDSHAPLTYRAQAQTDVSAYWMHFEGEASHRFYSLIHQRLGTVITAGRFDNALGAIRRVYDMFHGGRDVSEALMSLSITEILTECLTADESTDQLYRHRSIEEVLAYIASHLTEPLPLEQLARMASMSKCHFIRIFKQATGYTPHLYIVTMRMNAAKTMLVNSDVTLAVLCSECGFNSINTFCTQFKKAVGCTPMEFRQHGMDRAAAPYRTEPAPAGHDGD